MVVYNHWTGLVDWSGGLHWWIDIFYAKKSLVFPLMKPHSPVGLVMRHFNGHTILFVYRLEVNNCRATTVVRPCFALCLMCSMV